MACQLPRSGFSDVDRDRDPGDLIRLLDLRTGDRFHRAYKDRAFALLGLREGDRLLDVGCGTGDDVSFLAQAVGPGGCAIGVDASATLVAEAYARHAGNGCLAVRTFQHLADPRRALAEMVRVVRSGGTLAVVDPDHDTAVIDVAERALVRRFLNFRADTIRNGGIAHHMPTLFKDLGLRDVTVLPMTDVRTDYAEVEAASHYEGGIRVAHEVGVLTAEEAERLVRAMREAAAADRFLSAMTYVLTAGRNA
jgi:SAM-dependent methyltransferase